MDQRTNRGSRCPRVVITRNLGVMKRTDAQLEHQIGTCTARWKECAGIKWVGGTQISGRGPAVDEEDCTEWPFRYTRSTNRAATSCLVTWKSREIVFAVPLCSLQISAWLEGLLVRPESSPAHSV